MLVLSVDSSYSTATCALIKDDKILAEINLNDKKQHSVILMRLIDSILKEYEIDINDIDDLEIVKALLDYIYKKRDSNSTVYRQKKAAMNKIKQIVVDSGIYIKK